MDYILQNWWQLAIAIFIGSGCGWIACALMIGADFSGLEVENTLLKGALREKEKQLDAEKLARMMKGTV